MCTTDVKKYIYPDGKGRIVEQKYFCFRSDGVNPCSSHTRRESSDWVALNTASSPSSPAASLIQDGYPSSSSPRFPPTPSSANIEVREPSFLGRSSSLRDKGQRRTKRYYINGAEIKVTRSGNRKGKEKAYDKRPSTHKKHHSDDDVVVVNVGDPPSVFEAPTPPPAAPGYSQPGNAFSVPPPPPPPPPAPRIPLSSQQPPTSPISDRRRRPRPQVIIADQRDANPPAVPSSSSRPSTPLRRTTFGEYLPRQPTPPTYQTTTHVPGGDNEVLDRQAAREEARRDNKRRAEAKKMQQEERDAQTAAALARKLKLEQGEEYLAQLEQNRFAARDAARDETRRRREEEAEREHEEKRESDRRKAEQERLDHELTKAQAALDETKAQMAHERRNAENREARERAERLEREVREEEEQLARLQRQRQQEEIRQAEREVRRLQERGRERERLNYDDPRRSGRIDGPRFGDRREIRAAPRRDVDVIHHSPRDDRWRDPWRDRGERVIADARAQARSQDLNRGLRLEDEEDDLYRSYGGRRYYWENGRKRYY